MTEKVRTLDGPHSTVPNGHELASHGVTGCLIAEHLGGTFRYDYSIVNSGVDPLDEVAVVDIQVLPGDLTLSVVALPLGFSGFYDVGLGLVSFFPTWGCLVFSQEPR